VERKKSPIVDGLSTWTHTRYIKANCEMVAQRKWTGSQNGSTQRMTADPIDQYFHGDHLGSIVAITDASKAVVERFSHETWGKRRNATGWADLDPSGTDLLDRLIARGRSDSKNKSVPEYRQ
jgi:hypothetical protein